MDLLHQIIDHSASRHPTREAFRFDGAGITYRELLQQSNGFAHRLVEDGAHPGDRVGILLPKSLRLPTAVFGSLKAGCVHVPLDSTMPADRLVSILLDADIRRVVISPEQTALTAKLVARSNLELVIGGNHSEDLVCRTLHQDEIEPRQHPPAVTVAATDPAYLLFTSGSTGEPKGILHSHGSAMAYAQLAAETYSLCEDDRLGNFAPLHFDQSTFEFYAGPARAATTILIPPAFGIATESLAALIESEALTVWYSVPSILIQLLVRDALQGKRLDSLRWVLFGGEPFPPRHVRSLMKLLPRAQFSNVYGPTEVNQCTVHNFDSSDPLDEEIPIGNVWPRAKYLLIDGDGTALNGEAIGEFIVNTPTMMLGYWKRDDLTKAAHYKHESNASGTTRFYRTGDLMRRDGEGQLWFVGRKDRQVKSRGYRVELDDIESVLCSHPAVSEAASYTVPGDELGVFLEAAVLGDENILSERELMKHCALRLPTYARPRIIHILDSFPRTRTGKTDRAALEQALAPPAKNS